MNNTKFSYTQNDFISVQQPFERFSKIKSLSPNNFNCKKKNNINKFSK